MATTTTPRTGLPWFRFHARTVNNPKIQQLPGDLFKFWANCLCVVADSGRELPPAGDLAFILRMPKAEVESFLAELVDRDLLDESEDGSLFPHDWDDWQSRSDSSTERVRSFRKRKKETEGNQGNVTETLHNVSVNGSSNGIVTSQIRADKNRTEETLSGALESQSVPVQPPTETETALADTALLIHANHPQPRRDIGPKAVQKLLARILKRKALSGPKAVEYLQSLGARHAAWSNSARWKKEGGEFAKGLANWLAPTEDRYDQEPPDGAVITIDAEKNYPKPSSADVYRNYDPELQYRLRQEKIRNATRGLAS